MITTVSVAVGLGTGDALGDGDALAAGGTTLAGNGSADSCSGTPQPTRETPSMATNIGLSALRIVGTNRNLNGEGGPLGLGRPKGQFGAEQAGLLTSNGQAQARTLHMVGIVPASEWLEELV